MIDNAQVDFVFYDRNTDNYVFDEHFALLYDWDLRRLKENMTIEEKIEELSILCTCVSPFIKTNDWAFENEFRIVKYKHYGPKPNHEFLKDLRFHGIKETKVEPYVYCNIGSKALEEVLLGPLTNYDVVEHILRKELEECLLNDVEITPSSIAISK